MCVCMYMYIFVYIFVCVRMIDDKGIIYILLLESRTKYILLSKKKKLYINR